MQKTGRFNKGTNRGTKRCRLCKVLRQEANIDPSTGLCQKGITSCYDMAGQENAHSDLEGSTRSHEISPQEGCPICHPELEALYTPEGRAKEEGR